jgi:hypothetical protein
MGVTATDSMSGDHLPQQTYKPLQALIMPSAAHLKLGKINGSVAKGLAEWMDVSIQTSWCGSGDVGVHIEPTWIRVDVKESIHNPCDTHQALRVRPRRPIPADLAYSRLFIGMGPRFSVQKNLLVVTPSTVSLPTKVALFL